MPTFRFRASVALDLRRKEEASALAARALAQARFHELQSAIAAAREDQDRARADLTTLERQGTEVGTLLWHRNWNTRLTAAIERLQRELDERANDLRTAEEAWREARRRRLALERMKERAWERHLRAEAHQEMTEMNELARIRYVMPDTWRHES
ncbi:MAG: flagellar FliJ family protein [Vicinamibacterales bacterium]